MKILLMPFVFIYHFVRYVFWGIIALPLLIVRIFTGGNSKKIDKSKNVETAPVSNNGSAVSINTKNQSVSASKGKKVHVDKKQKLIKGKSPIVIDFNGADAVKYDTKQPYEYLITDRNGNVQKGFFSALSKADVYSYLTNDGATVYDIKLSKDIFRGKGMRVKIKTKDLIFMLAQLSTYLKSGIELLNSMKILSKQFAKNQSYKQVLDGVVYELSTGQTLSEAMSKQGNAFPRLLINMIKASEMTGELPETLDDMDDYYTQTEATRKAMVSAMMYPVIIFIFAIGVGTFIMLYVVPKFVEIYQSLDDADIPMITKFVLGLSSFLKSYIIWIGLGVIVILLIFMYLYKNVKAFRSGMQWFVMHLPVFGNVVIYNEVTMFTKTFASLLAHNVFITDSMEILNKVTNNEIYKSLIHDAMDNVAKGGNISTAFADHWAFPLSAYEMIVTGENTGQLPEMMSKVAAYFQDLHANSVNRIKTFIEPVLIVMLTVMVGVIVLSIVVPMFNMYGAIQQ